MSSAFTPGPWAWDECGNFLKPITPAPETSSVHTILSPDGCFGYLGSDFHKTGAEDKANKRLIETAPQLLDAAQAAAAVLGRQKWVSGSTDPEAVALFKLLAAIAKATGEPS